MQLEKYQPQKRTFRVQQTDSIFKVLILGDVSVGKTKLLESIHNYSSFKKNLRSKFYFPIRTSFIDFYLIKLFPKRIFYFLDFKGGKKDMQILKLIQKSILNGVSLIIFTFSFDITKSFESIFDQNGWYEMLGEEIEKLNIPTIFVGNKRDKKSGFRSESARKFCNKLPTSKGFITTSAITSEGINDLVLELRKIF
ncbi:MAG: hypothetical protein HeimC3_53200 [Candidatus Heimdallarchaeota archaeon LC_3]|nr:MAG: hypothetical protein HeimC3_53200 [Candidatus Heimdallarchaeota archaeon LC_3]